jgi:hypothetical protein
MGLGLGGERNIVFSQRWYRNITVKWWMGRLVDEAVLCLKMEKTASGKGKRPFIWASG